MRRKIDPRQKERNFPVQDESHSGTLGVVWRDTQGLGHEPCISHESFTKDLLFTTNKVEIKFRSFQVRYRNILS